MMTLLYGVWMVVDFLTAAPGTALWAGWRAPRAWALLFISALLPGMLADVLQNRGQRHLGASETNIILSSEPLWTALLSLVFLGEVMGLSAWCGGGLIVAAALLASLGDLGTAAPTETDTTPDGTAPAA